MVYFNDILIYSKYENGHLDHLEQVMVVIQINNLYINLKMCTFLTNNVICLGFIIGTEGI